MTKKELYTCDICHTDYANKSDALECEKTHYMAASIKDCRYNAHSKYPHKIEVKFADGISHWYKL